MSFSSDGNQLVVAYYSAEQQHSRIEYWDLADKQAPRIQGEMAADTRVTSVRFVPGDRALLVGQESAGEVALARQYVLRDLSSGAVLGPVPGEQPALGGAALIACTSEAPEGIRHSRRPTAHHPEPGLPTAQESSVDATGRYAVVGDTAPSTVHSCFALFAIAGGGRLACGARLHNFGRDLRFADLV